MRLTEKHLWLDLRVRRKLNYAEAYEHRPADTTAFICIALGPGIVFSLLYGLAFGIDVIWLIFASLFFLFPTMLAVGIYRTPRSIRLYPVEQLAQVSRCFYGLRYRKRWVDLSDAGYAFYPAEVMAYDPEESKTETMIGCLLTPISPLNVYLWPLLRRLFRARLPTPALAFRSSDENQRPLIVVKEQAQAKQIIDLVRRMRLEHPA